MASITLESVDKTYPNGHVAAQGIDLRVADGEFVVLVGPSGCGKSTTLRMVAGLETPTAGRILIGDEDVTRLPPQDRDIAMVFQTYALYPHKTVRDNLAFGLRMRGVARETIGARVERAARTLGLEEFLERKPGQLSGGQRQRVALGRAIVREPRAFLLDEPLSNLDAKLRVQTRAELARMHRDLGATMLYVTHDQEEAMTLGDRIAVMHGGRIQHVAQPLEVYDLPANAFVAGFIGSPAMNFFDGRLRREGGRLELSTAEFSLVLSDVELDPSAGPEVTMGIRPQDVIVVSPDDHEVDASARVDVVEPLGSALLIHLRVAADVEAPDLRIMAPPDTSIREGEAAGLRFRRDRLHLFDRRSGDRLN